MNLSTIPQLYRNANRWREIISVLSKHGLADWVSRLGLPTVGGIARRSNGEKATISGDERIRLAFEELGPTFIKLGQVLATRPDLVGVELASELTKLQTNAPADPPKVVKETVEHSLGKPIETLFASFDIEPIASGSIGQVHRARLNDQTEVAVKVRHPGIEKIIRADVEILAGLAELAERINELRPYRPQATVREFERTLRRELDLQDERRRIEQFLDVFENDERICLPKPHAEVSSEAVLTIDWLDGKKISDDSLSYESPELLAKVARNGAEIYLEMVFEHGLYHADPHPGNLLVMPEGVIGLLDFGMVGRLSERLREDLEDMLIAVATNDAEQLVSSLTRVVETNADFDHDAFAIDIADFVDHYGNQSVGKFDLAGAITELFKIVRRWELVLPAQISMLLKMIVMLEGTAQKLEPNFSLLEVVVPLQKRMMLRRLSPKRQAKKLRRLYGDLELLAEETPRRLRDLLKQIQTGRFEVHLEHRGLEPSVNRLVLGLVTSALIVGSSLMVSGEVLPLWGVSAPGAVGFAVSGLLGVRLWWAIRKSGWLDSPQDRN